MTSATCEIECVGLSNTSDVALLMGINPLFLQSEINCLQKILPMTIWTPRCSRTTHNYAGKIRLNINLFGVLFARGNAARKYPYILEEIRAKQGSKSIICHVISLYVHLLFPFEMFETSHF